MTGRDALSFLLAFLLYFVMTVAITAKAQFYDILFSDSDNLEHHVSLETTFHNFKTLPL